MTTYALILQIHEPQQIEAIFGRHITASAMEEIDSGFRDITALLLERFELLQETTSPTGGLWYTTFTCREPSLLLNMEEHVGTISLACHQLVRKMFQQLFGNASGSRLPFKTSAALLGEDLDRSEHLDRIMDILAAEEIEGLPYAKIDRQELSEIIRGGHIQTYLQPIINMADEALIGYEALSRGPDHSPLYQAALLFGSAAHHGLTEDMEMAGIIGALEIVHQLPDEQVLFMNTGPALLASKTLYKYLTQHRFRAVHHRLILEITEHLPIQAAEDLCEAREKYKAKGIRLALDDTGCGFADLETVRILHPDVVKLCITVIRQLGQSPFIMEDIRKTTAQIMELGAQVLAEGVERRAQVDLLADTDITLAQGYYFGKPRPASKVLGTLP